MSIWILRCHYGLLCIMNINIANWYTNSLWYGVQNRLSAPYIYIRTGFESNRDNRPPAHLDRPKWTHKQRNKLNKIITLWEWELRRWTTRKEELETTTLWSDAFCIFAARCTSNRCSPMANGQSFDKVRVLFSLAIKRVPRVGKHIYSIV